MMNEIIDRWLNVNHHYHYCHYLKPRTSRQLFGFHCQLYHSYDCSLIGNDKCAPEGGKAEANGMKEKLIRSSTDSGYWTENFQWEKNQTRPTFDNSEIYNWNNDRLPALNSRTKAEKLLAVCCSCSSSTLPSSGGSDLVLFRIAIGLVYTDHVGGRSNYRNDARQTDLRSHIRHQSMPQFRPPPPQPTTATPTALQFYHYYHRITTLPARNNIIQSNNTILCLMFIENGCCGNNDDHGADQSSSIRLDGIIISLHNNGKGNLFGKSSDLNQCNSRRHFCCYHYFSFYKILATNENSLLLPQCFFNHSDLGCLANDCGNIIYFDFYYYLFTTIGYVAVIISDYICDYCLVPPRCPSYCWNINKNVIDNNNNFVMKLSGNEHRIVKQKEKEQQNCQKKQRRHNHNFNSDYYYHYNYNYWHCFRNNRNNGCHDHRRPSASASSAATTTTTKRNEKKLRHLHQHEQQRRRRRRRRPQGRTRGKRRKTNDVVVDFDDDDDEYQNDQLTCDKQTSAAAANYDHHHIKCLSIKDSHHDDDDNNDELLIIPKGRNINEENFINAEQNQTSDGEERKFIERIVDDSLSVNNSSIITTNNIGDNDNNLIINYGKKENRIKNVNSTNSGINSEKFSPTIFLSRFNHKKESALIDENIDLITFSFLKTSTSTSLLCSSVSSSDSSNFLNRHRKPPSSRCLLLSRFCSYYYLSIFIILTFLTTTSFASSSMTTSTIPTFSFTSGTLVSKTSTSTKTSVETTSTFVHNQQPKPPPSPPPLPTLHSPSLLHLTSSSNNIETLPQCSSSNDDKTQCWNNQIAKQVTMMDDHSLSNINSSAPQVDATVDVVDDEEKDPPHSPTSTNSQQELTAKSIIKRISLNLLEKDRSNIADGTASSKQQAPSVETPLASSILDDQLNKNNTNLQKYEKVSSISANLSSVSAVTNIPSTSSLSPFITDMFTSLIPKSLVNHLFRYTSSMAKKSSASLLHHSRPRYLRRPQSPSKNSLLLSGDDYDGDVESMDNDDVLIDDTDDEDDDEDLLNLTLDDVEPSPGPETDLPSSNDNNNNLVMASSGSMTSNSDGQLIRLMRTILRPNNNQNKVVDHHRSRQPPATFDQADTSDDETGFIDDLYDHRSPVISNKNSHHGAISVSSSSASSPRFSMVKSSILSVPDDQYFSSSSSGSSSSVDRIFRAALNASIIPTADLSTMNFNPLNNDNHRIQDLLVKNVTKATTSMVKSSLVDRFVRDSSSSQGNSGHVTLLPLSNMVDGFDTATTLFTTTIDSLVDNMTAMATSAVAATSSTQSYAPYSSISSDNSSTTPMGAIDWLDIVIIVLKVLILGIIILAAIFGNLLVIIAVFRHHRLRITTNYFIVSLAFADILVALFAMTFNASVVISGKWIFNTWVCDFWNSCDVLFSTASIMHLSCISYDRYYAIIKPLDYPMKVTGKRVAIMLTCVWISSALISYIPIFTGIYTTNEAIEARQVYTDQCEWVVNIPYALISSTVSFWLPCGIMLSAYYKIYREAIKQEKFIYRTQQMANQSNHHHHHHQIKKNQQNNNNNNNNNNDEDGTSHRLNAPKNSTASENNVIQIQSASSHRNSHCDPDPESGSSTPTKRTISKMKREHKAAKTLGIIMGAFILCWLPFFIWYVTSTITGWNTPQVIVDILFWVGYLNSAMNPIIYAYFNREFREAFKETLRNIFCRCLHLKCLESQRNDAISFSCTYTYTRSNMDADLVENKFVKD